VRLIGPSFGATSLAVLLLASLVHSESGTTKERARLRQGPSGTSDALGEVDAGTRLQLLGESGGWRQVRTPDGRIGYLWNEHLAPRDAERNPEARKSDAPTTVGRSLADEVHDLRDEVAALRQRPEPATAADLQQVRQEVERLAGAERDLARRFDDRFVPSVAVADPPPDGPGALAPALLVLGGVLGFAASRVLQRRRDSRQHHRLRL